MINKGKFHGPLHVYGNTEVVNALQVMCQLMIPAKICRVFGTDIIFHNVDEHAHYTIGDMEVDFFDIGSTKKPQAGFSALVEGKRIVCLGDEPYHELSKPWVQDCDWLLCEAFCLYRDREQFRPYEKHHSTALDAGIVAEGLGVKNLLLYHTEDTHLAVRRQLYTAEAQRNFTKRIEVPDDIETVNLF